MYMYDELLFFPRIFTEPFEINFVHLGILSRGAGKYPGNP